VLARTGQGQTAETSIVGREGVIGSSSIHGVMTSFAETVVQVAGEAVRIPAAEIHRVGRQSDSFRNIVALFDLSLLAQSQQSTACQALHHVENRAARWLLQCQRRVGRDDIRLTQEFFAQMLGVQRTTVNMVERTFQNAGLIQIGRGRISILDPEGLQATSCDCYLRIERRYEAAGTAGLTFLSIPWNETAIAVFVSCRSVRYPTLSSDRRERARAAKPQRSSSMQPCASRRPVVLIVEDEALVRLDAIETIESAGFEVVEAGDADEAIAILEQRADIHLIFTDIHMPGSMDGLKLAHYVKDRWPPVKIIATTGHARITEDDLPLGGRFLPKPYSTAQITGTIRELING
jgi:CheY-like chemotaxis protein/CRP-like cAMP-binding protein